jgi:hypothetical protein
MEKNLDLNKYQITLHQLHFTEASSLYGYRRENKNLKKKIVRSSLNENYFLELNITKIVNFPYSNGNQAKFSF